MAGAGLHVENYDLNRRRCFASRCRLRFQWGGEIGADALSVICACHIANVNQIGRRLLLRLTADRNALFLAYAGHQGMRKGPAKVDGPVKGGNAVQNTATIILPRFVQRCCGVVHTGC